MPKFQCSRSGLCVPETSQVEIKTDGMTYTTLRYKILVCYKCQKRGGTLVKDSKGYKCPTC